MARAGRYRKTFFDPKMTPFWAQSFLPLIQTQLNEYQDQQISAAELCGSYIELFLQNFYKSKPFGAKLPPQSLKLARGSTYLKNWEIFSFKGIKLATNRSLIQWHNGDYPLELHFNIPTPLEVLRIQSLGKRCVSIMAYHEQVIEYQKLDRDPVSFLIHDLIHADQFYFQNEMYRCQRVLNQIFYSLYLQQHWDLYFDFQPEFKSKLDYVFSDMNAHPIHLLKVLKSDLVKTPFWQDTLSKISLLLPKSSSFTDLFEKLNTKEENSNLHKQIVVSIELCYPYFFEKFDRQKTL
jgi:hypothetical protein